MRAVVLVLIAACARPVAPIAVADAPVLPHEVMRIYTLWLDGARIGTATERETWSDDGVQLQRIEQLRYLRGASKVVLATAIDIDADAALVPARVTWTERDASGASHAVTAVRHGDTWRVDEAGVQLPDGAIPAELVPLLVRRDGHFAGPVFLPARGFVAGEGHVAPVAPGRLVARLALASGAVAEATIDLARDGSPWRVVDGDGVTEVRATSAHAGWAFRPTDLIALTAVPIAGVHSGPRILLDCDLLQLPAVPGQASHPTKNGIVVQLGAALPGGLSPGPAGADRLPEIVALVAAVRARIRPDLGAAPTNARAAVDATAGDCTTYALAYAALAIARGIPTRIVTGLRVDGDRLVRHRWAVSWTGRAWIAVDAAFGDVPAGGKLVGLAVGDADDPGLVAGEAALSKVRAAMWVAAPRIEHAAGPR